jgi:SAM-dependent methyltransferase
VETISAPFYDFPKYYDLVYGSDWKAEYDFLQACFKKYANGKVERLFEPACGTGRLLIKLAAAGYEVGGNDLNAKAVTFCNERLQRHGYPPSAVVGDMSNFCLDRPVDAAFNTINSFRHLTTESAAMSHLQCMAQALRPGGLYLLGLHLTPGEGEPTEEESWSARRGNLAVLTRFWVIQRDLPQRQEMAGMSYDIYTPTRQFRILDQSCFRTYSAEQLYQLLERIPEFDITSIHDFGYDIDKPIEIDSKSEDVVLVLKKTDSCSSQMARTW